MLTNVFQVVLLFGRALLATILIAAGAAKLADVKSFVATLKGLQITFLHNRSTHVLAIIVPLIELFLGFLSLTGLWVTFTNMAIGIMMLGFAAIILFALMKNLSVSCRCFGALSDSQFSRKGLLRSVLLTALAATVFWGDVVYPFPPVGLTNALLLAGGYVLFAIAAAQAANTFSVLKERTS